jgi:hypothetical protein
MIEKFSKPERKLLKHCIHIYENQLMGLPNSLMTLYRDYGRPKSKCPLEIFGSPALTEEVLASLFDDAQSKMKIIQKQDLMVNTKMAMSYLREMDTDNYNNLDMWIRFGEIENVWTLLSEILDDEQNDASDDYFDLPS